MSIRRPSPAMVVACIALFVALGGTSIAAVNYARNASHVDGKNAFKSKRSRDKVAGGLVATYPGGHLKGRIAHRFLAETPLSRPYWRGIAVADNSSSAVEPLTNTGSLGSLVMTCTDQNKRAGVKDPRATISFVNGSPGAINVAKRVGVGKAQIATVQPNTVASVTISGSNTYELQISAGDTEVLINGVARQVAARTETAACLVYGTALQLTK